MSVSHTLMAGAQVIGAAVGLLGFFFVSVGLFGKDRKNLLRPLLPALALGSLGLVGPMLVQAPGQRPAMLTTMVSGVLWLVTGYYMGYFGQSPEPHRQNKARSIGLYFYLPVLMGMILAAYLWPTTTVGLTLLSIVLVAAVLATLYLPRRMDDRTMITVGASATVVAFLAQIVPPMLDLLGIPIR